jgi:hypothetical protein
MGADGREKRREWLHEAIDFIRVFAYFVFAKHTQKRLKYGYFEQMLHPVFLPPEKRQTKVSISSAGDQTAWRIVLGKASRWKQLLNAII